MATKIPVNALYGYLDQMLADRWGYIWGTAGVLWTEARQAATDNEMAQKYGRQWIGHYVTDCSGVMVYIWKQYGLTIPHGSNSIRRRYVGALQDTPAPGYAAFKRRGDDFYHIGIVGANGETVYEARGTRDGFVISNASAWDVFAPFAQVDYTEGGETMPQTEPLYEARVTTRTGALNLRSGPGTGYPIVAKIPRGETVEVLTEYETGWDYVRHSARAGYVSAEYLTPVNGSETRSEAPVAGDGETPTEGETNGSDAKLDVSGAIYAVYCPCMTREQAEAVAREHPGTQILQMLGYGEGV